MASNICQHLLNKVWRSYANDLDEAPEDEGIYTIGLVQPDGNVWHIYVGHSTNIRRRLRQHKCQNLAIDKFVKLQFTLYNGQNLVFKWVKERNGQCVEGFFLNCMSSKLGYWPEFNKKRGNTCY